MERNRRASVATMQASELEEYTTKLPSFGESDGSEDGCESEDEDAMLASLSHEELCEMLSETRAQLAQAAEMGQALMAELQQMELLKQDNAQLQEQKEEWEAAQEEHEWRIEELEEAQVQLQETVEDQQAQIQELEKQSEKQAEEHRKTVSRLREAGGTDDAQAVEATVSGSAGVRLDFAAEKRPEQDEGISSAAWRARVSSLEAEIVDVKVERAELIESKRQMEEVRVASERERKKSAEKELRTREELEGAEAKLAKAQKMAEKGFAVATKATNRANSLELRLRMLEREFNYLREALQEPDKAEAVEKRLFSLANVFADEPEAKGSSESAPASPKKRPTRDLTLMISKNDIVPDNHRLKLKVASLMELEAVLQTKLKIDHPVALMVWDRAFDDFVTVMSFEDVDARSKVQLVKKEEPLDAAEEVKAELDAEVESEPEPEPEPEPASTDDSSNSLNSASLSLELEREKRKIEELRISLAAAQADAEHNRKLTATANAQLKAALGSDRYEEQQRKRIARSVETQRTRCLRRLLESRFIDWKLNALKAAQLPEELAAMKAEQAAEAERREKDQAELAAKLESEQQKTAEVERQLRESEEMQEQKRKEELMKAAFAQTQLPITGCRCLGAFPVLGENDKRYIVYRILVSVAQDKGGTPEMKRPWVVARKFALFKNLRLALRAVPGQAKAITAPFPKEARRLKKASAESEATAMERCGVLETWVNEVVSKFRNHPLITDFLKNDGSDVAVADITMARKLLTGSGDAGESSNAIRISRCKLERVLGAEGLHRMGSRSPLEKSHFLLSTSRAVEGMPVIKKSHILSVLTPASRPDAERSKLLAALLADLQHPFVHRSHDAQYGGYMASKNEEKTPKLLVLRDFVPNGSIRDMLFANKHPMKGYEEKYPADSKGAALEDQTAGVGLRVVAKQVLLGMRYLELVGIPVDRIAHCGNILVLHDGSQGRPVNVAISDVEVAAVGMQGSNAKHIADAQIRRPADASVYAFGLLLHELATGEQADHDAQRWPPNGFKVWSMPVQALLGKIFAQGKDAPDSITTLAQVEQHHALRDIKLHDSQTDGMPDEDTVSALRAQYSEHLGFQATPTSKD